MIDKLPKPQSQALLKQVGFNGGTQLSDQDLERERELLNLEQSKQRFELESERLRLDMALKRMTAARVFTFLGIETLLVLLIVILQGLELFGFELRDATLNIFVTATIIQISTMAVIITKHLFPTENKKTD